MSTDPESSKEQVHQSLELLLQDADAFSEVVAELISQIGEDQFIQRISDRVQDPSCTTEELMESQALLLIYADLTKRDDLVEYHVSALVGSSRDNRRFGISAYASTILIDTKLKLGKPVDAVDVLIDGYNDCLLFEAGEDTNETFIQSLQLRDFIRTAFYQGPLQVAHYLKDKVGVAEEIIKHCQMRAVDTLDIEREVFARNILVTIYAVMEDYEAIEPETECVEELSVQRGRFHEASLMAGNIANINLAKGGTEKVQAALERIMQYRLNLLRSPETSGEELASINACIQEIQSKLDAQE